MNICGQTLNRGWRQQRKGCISMYQMYIEKVLFPVTPGKLTVKINGMNKTLTLVNEGEVNLIKSPGLTDISTEVLLPTLTHYPFATYLDTDDDGEGNFHRANYYLEKLEKWKQKKKPVTFKLLRTSPNGKKLLWDTNISVTIEDYQIVEDAEEQGLDVVVKIEMREYREWGAKKLVIKKSKKKKSKKKKTATKKKTRKTKDPAKSYTVKKGDCMWAIARKQLGNGNRWKEIYNLNKSTIESWAKKYGHKSAIEGTGCWIFPGEKLKLPKK